MLAAPLPTGTVRGPSGGGFKSRTVRPGGIKRPNGGGVKVNGMRHAPACSGLTMPAPRRADSRDRVSFQARLNAGLLNNAARMQREIPSTNQKALQINLDTTKY